MTEAKAKGKSSGMPGGMPGGSAQQILTAMVGGAVLIFGLMAINLWHRTFLSKPPSTSGAVRWLAVEHSDQPFGILLGSSNLLTSVDAALLDTLTHARGHNMQWVHLSQRGLAGVELLSVARDVLAQCETPPEMLVLEWIVPAADAPPAGPNWRYAQHVRWADAAGFLETERALDPRAWRDLALHGVMRATSGLHRLLRPLPADETSFFPKGDITPSTRSWPVRNARDSVWAEGLKTAEARMLRDGENTAGEAEKECQILRDIAATCAARGVALRVVVQPACGLTPALHRVSAATGQAPIRLGLDRRSTNAASTDPPAHSPFSDPKFLSDGRHVNALGAQRVTRQLAPILLPQCCSTP